MSDTTIFLAQLWGPILLVLGIGIFTSRQYYKKVYRDLEQETLAVMMTAGGLMAVGIAQVLAHNVWAGIPASIVTLLGWLTLAKGLALALLPKAIDGWGNRVAASKNFFPVMGVAMAALGLYLGWVGYFS